MKKSSIILSLSGVLFSVALLGQAQSVKAETSQPAIEVKQVENNVDVSTWEEFKEAINDDTVTDISLSSDITMATTESITNLSKNIHGNGHTIDADLHQLYFTKADAVGLMENVKIINTDIYGLLWSSHTANITYKNVEHTGRQMIYLPEGKLTLDGKVSSVSTTEEVYQGKELEVKPGAVINFENESTTIPAVHMIHSKGILSVGKDAQVTIKSNTTSVLGGTNFSFVNEGNIVATSADDRGINLGASSTLELKDGSHLKIHTDDTVYESILVTSGNLFVRKGATIEADSTGNQSTIIAGKEIIFENGSNYSITNHHKEGPVLGGYATTAHVTLDSETGYKLWWVDRVEEAEPEEVIAGPVKSSFSILGYTHAGIKTSDFSSTDEHFGTTPFANYGKIQGGSFVDDGIVIEKPVFNAVTDQDKELTGTGTPGATVNAYVNGDLIGTGTVDSEGNWTITIDPQAEGTKVDVNQVVDGKESEMVSQVVTHEEKVDAPVFNVVNDKDKQLTGLGVPGATINAYVDGVLLGTGTVEADGRWTITIEPQTEGTKIDVNQVIDGNESEFVSQIVSHLDQTVNFFKTGYWQSYGLILEGSMDNGNLDLTNQDAVKKTLHLTAADGTEVGTIACANQDWYNHGVFNGYQGIIDNTLLGGLEPGEYKLSVTLQVGDFDETQDLNVTGSVRDDYQHVFTDIEETTVGSHTISTLDKDGIGYLVVK
ncbi:pectate lyase-like adhesive domain-containing protein [Enterococcus thailandicus]|uniref:pectate lyase-like adhesive domain-containing protein n=1 Tax=Enterococcus thailandicus TaxID=417368 RepID=UPI002890CF99|nr:pectate lyase-like adhesive domain-containing protein [Enterococcus thailandicus]MDT2750503.1 Ig-like domain-containing protein [Enterococcus thailandicus]MDT2775063.1 Ig-like domain-containing protein [Enterococcus thailandicus]